MRHKYNVTTRRRSPGSGLVSGTSYVAPRRRSDTLGPVFSLEPLGFVLLPFANPPPTVRFFPLSFSSLLLSHP